MSTGDRLARRALMGGFMGLTIPYFRMLNRVDAYGTEILHSLPHRNVVFLSNHQTYFTEAIAFFDLLYRRSGFKWEDPFLRFSAAEETMGKNAVTSLLAKSGAVTFKRSHRDGGQDLKRDSDAHGLSRIEEAIRAGWLLHFPTGTTRPGAEVRHGVAGLLHRTEAVAVPMRVEGFRDLLLHKQIPGRVGKRASITIHEPLDLKEFYSQEFTRESGIEVVRQISEVVREA